MSAKYLKRFLSARNIQRDIDLLQAFAAGESNAVIGRKLGVSRERVRQLLERLSIRRRQLKCVMYPKRPAAPASVEPL